jgi:hypothetical protein
MTELQKDTLVQLVETGMKVSDEFFTNYTKVDVKTLRKNQVNNLKWFTKMQRTWIENSKNVMHPMVVEKALDFNDVWERIYNTWEENKI